jgi:hypothetical protein
MMKNAKHRKRSRKTALNAGFGAAPNKEQDQFDAEQKTLTEAELKTQVTALVAL